MLSMMQPSLLPPPPPPLPIELSQFRFAPPPPPGTDGGLGGGGGGGGGGLPRWSNTSACSFQSVDCLVRPCAIANTASLLTTAPFSTLQQRPSM